MDFKDLNIQLIDKGAWGYFFSELKELAPLLGWIFGVLAAISLVVIFLLSKNTKNEEKKKYMNYLFSLFSSHIFGATLILGLLGAGFLGKTQSIEDSWDRIYQIEDNAYENILMKYNLDNIPQEDFVFWENNKDKDFERELNTVSVAYSDLEKETRYTLIFDFKDNEPILMKTGTVDETIIKSLEK